MSELAIVPVATIVAIFVLAFTALLLGRKLNFKVNIWKAANVEFSTSERRQTSASEKK